MHTILIIKVTSSLLKLGFVCLWDTPVARKVGGFMTYKGKSSSVLVMFPRENISIQYCSISKYTQTEFGNSIGCE
ncbi:hypothetical protein Bca4012_064280 [Brassica carinata]